MPLPPTTATLSFISTTRAGAATETIPQRPTGRRSPEGFCHPLPPAVLRPVLRPDKDTRRSRIPAGRRKDTGRRVIERSAYDGGLGIGGKCHRGALTGCSNSPGADELVAL